MSWIFAPVDPRQSGIASRPELPLGRYLRAAWDQGTHDSAFDSVSRMVERGLYAEGDLVDPEEANRLYGLPGLRFERPTHRGVAQLMSERKRQELDRQAVLSMDDNGIAKIAAGFGVGMIASLVNPLDFALNFVPVVGQAKYARAASIMGRGAIRQGIARGLITEEALAHAIKYPRVTGALIEGTVGQLVAEVPLAISNMQDQADYGKEDFLLNVSAGGVFAGVLRGGIDAAARIVRKLQHGTRVRMFRMAVEQAIRGEEIDVRAEAEADPKIVEERVKWDPKVKRAEAERYVDSIMPELRTKVAEKYAGEKVTAAAVRSPDGEVFTGEMHGLAYLAALQKRDPEALKKFDEQEDSPGTMLDIPAVRDFDEGFVTSAGRYISREEADALTGEAGEMMIQGSLARNFSKQTWIEKQVDVGESAEDAALEWEAVQRELRSMTELPTFWQQPHVKEALQKERERAIKRYIEAERRKYKRVVSAPDIAESEASVKENLPEEVPAEEDVAAVEEALQRELAELQDLEEAAMPDLVITVQAPQKLGKDTVPGYVQVDRNTKSVEGGTESTNPEALQKEGIPIPSTQMLSQLPQGKYTLMEALKKLGEVETDKLVLELDGIKAELADDITAHKAALNCLTDNG